MAKAKKLKVFRTPIGFHDAYVAAPSRKAALEAWGAGTDLFSAGIAEQVSPSASSGQAGEAVTAALEKPGEVVRIGRTGEGDASAGPGKAAKHKGKAKSKPKPSRAAVQKAEAAVSELQAKQSAERSDLAEEEEKLAKRRRALDGKHREAMERAEAKRDAAKAHYRKAMAEWDG